jgi:hypothetical protein
MEKERKIVRETQCSDWGFSRAAAQKPRHLVRDDPTGIAGKVHVTERDGRAECLILSHKRSMPFQT